MRGTLTAGVLALTIRVQAKLAPKRFETLPLGAIRPSGWLGDQLMVQTNGLAGHLHEFYDYVSDTDWVGGDSYYSYLEEAGSYWFNSMVPNAVLVNHTVLIQKTREFLDFVLDNQDETGWLGPEVLNSTKPRYLWGRYPFFLGAIGILESSGNTELEERFVDALYRFVSLANAMLREGQGVDKWAATRWEDFVLVLQWLYDYYPRNQDTLLIDTMRRLKWTGVPWEKVFSEKYFPKGPVENLTNPFDLPLAWHGVNMAEGLKALAVTYRFTHNQSDLDAASEAWDLMFRYHGRPSGAFAADEMLAGLEAVRGTELCLVVEAMFSGTYLFQVTGDVKYLDQVERMAYNALPATITSNMWGRQYLQQQNQIAAKNMTPNPFPEDGPESNIFGLEPNYPCCTVNFPQGWPKFIASTFLKTVDGQGLVQVYFGPVKVDVELTDGNRVQVEVVTEYPFSDVIDIRINARKGFRYHVRIPSWVVGGEFALDGQSRPMELGGDILPVHIQAGSHQLRLVLSSEIQVENRLHGSVAVHRGPLNFAFDIPRIETVLKRHPLQLNAVDLQFEPSAPWQYAIDPRTAVYRYTSPANDRLPSPIFDYGLSPVTVSVTACPINWDIDGDLFPASPPEEPECVGLQRTLILSPFGATKLRISEFPVFTMQGGREDSMQYVFNSTGPKV